MHPERMGSIEQKEKPKSIEIVRGSEAPKEYKENPFYNPYHWAMADWEERILYLPDESDEAFSFSIAAHELGHLVERGRIKPTRFDFEPSNKEELRAWAVGWSYLEKHLAKYFNGDTEVTKELKLIKDEIEKELMRLMELTRSFYQETANDGQKQREDFLATKEGTEVKVSIDGLRAKVGNITASLKLGKYLRKIDWNKYKDVVGMALLDVEEDNKKTAKD
jgi:hypothetical protein